MNNAIKTTGIFQKHSSGRQHAPPFVSLMQLLRRLSILLAVQKSMSAQPKNVVVDQAVGGVRRHRV